MQPIDIADDAFTVNVPEAHGPQKLSPVRPNVSWPGGHAAQSASSSWVLAAAVWSNPLYVLTPHTVQAVAPATGAICPAPHTLHWASAASPDRFEYLPAEHRPAQAASAVTPVAWDHLPAEQLLHWAA